MTTTGPRALAVIGGGASGIATFIAAVRRRAARIIYIIEPRSIGRGLAFGNTDEDVLSNTTVETMSLMPDDPLDFMRYLLGRGYAATPQTYPPRRWMGDYLVDRFRHYRKEAAECGIDVRWVPYRFKSLKIVGHRRYLLGLDRGDMRCSLTASDVVLCTGHGAPKIPEAFAPYRSVSTFHESLYPEARLLEKLAPKSNVLVVGTKLSAVDAGVLLCRQGHRVTMVSPSGAIPSVRARFAHSAIRLFDLERLKAILSRWDAQASADLPGALRQAYLRYFARIIDIHTGQPWRTQFSQAPRCEDRLREEIAIVERQGNPWQDMIVEFMLAINEVYRETEAYPTGVFHPRFRETIYRYVTSIALPNAIKLMRYIEEGLLTIVQGQPRDIAFVAQTTPSWRIDFGAGKQSFDRVVAATGFYTPRLVLNDAGELEIDAAGGSGGRPIHISRNLSVSWPHANRQESIWVVGMPAHERLWVPNALVIAVPMAYEVVGSMVDLFDRDYLREPAFPIDG